MGASAMARSAITTSSRSAMTAELKPSSSGSQRPAFQLPSLKQRGSFNAKTDCRRLGASFPFGLLCDTKDITGDT